MAREKHKKKNKRKQKLNPVPSETTRTQEPQGNKGDGISLYRIEYFVDENGFSPAQEWLEGLKDIPAKATIKRRITNLAAGSRGSWSPIKGVNGNIFELKIDMGPGYRVYCIQSGKEIIILLCGGDKSTQDKDARKAERYWNDYKRQCSEK